MVEDKQIRLRKMRFWLIGVLLIVFAAVITTGVIIPGLMRELFFWLGLIIAAVLIVACYFLYKWWIGRK